MVIMPKIIGIMASTNEGVIGKGNALPWHYKDELNHFRKITNNQVMVVGRKTFESAPSTLFKKKPIVFSKTMQSSERYMVTRSITEFLRYLDSINLPEIFMIGGAEIAELFFKENLISEFFLTKIHKDYDGDITMDLKFFDNWQQILLTQTDNYTIYKLINPKGVSYEIY